MADIREAARELGRRGGNARANNLTTGQRQESARRAAKARWGEVRKRPCALCALPLGAGKLAQTIRGYHGTSQLAHAECVASKPQELGA